MTLIDIVKGFKEYDRIVVTGPQRSGTQIASRIIADILGWKFVREDRICHKRQVAYFHDAHYMRWVTDPATKHVVLHCPRASNVCHLTPKDTLVVFMNRDVAEIIASDQHRIKLQSKKRRRVCSVFNDKRKEYSRLFFNNKEITIEETPQAVYDAWNIIQKKHSFDYYDFDYNLLEQHEMWLPLEVRRTFTKGSLQYKIDIEEERA